MRVLRRALELPRSHGVVFPNPGSSDGVIPDSTIRRMMRRAGVGASPHGFRSTFRTWAQERGENWEASQISLSHRVGSSVVMSYARSDMLGMRRGLMERYAEALGLLSYGVGRSVPPRRATSRCNKFQNEGYRHPSWKRYSPLDYHSSGELTGVGLAPNVAVSQIGRWPDHQ